jgi:hypothetical protein
MYSVGEIARISLPSQLERTREGYIESTCCCVQARFLGMETKNSFLFNGVVINPSLYNDVFINIILAMPL